MLHRIYTVVWIGAAVCLTLGFAVVGATWWVITHAAELRPRVEARLGILLERPVRIARLDATWGGWGPRLEAKEVDVYDATGQRPVLHLDAVRAELDLPYLIRHLTLGPSQLVVVGAQFALIRQPDGTLAVAGFENDQSDLEHNELIKRWLAHQQRLTLEARTLVWDDRAAGRAPVPLHRVTVRLRNSGQHHQVDLYGELPAPWGRQLAFSADFHGDLYEPARWNGRWYIDGAGLQAAQWLRGRSYAGLTVAAGSVDLTLWGKWRDGHAQETAGQAQLTGIDLRPEGAEASSYVLDSLHTHIGWRHSARGWMFALDHCTLTRGGRIYTPGAITVAVQPGEDLRVEVGYERLPAEELLPLLLASNILGADLREALTQLHIAAELRDGYVRYTRSGADAPQVQIHSTFERLNTRPWKHVPGIRDLAGEITAGADVGMVQLRGAAASIDFAGLFRAPLVVDAADGVVAWRHAEDGWHVQTRAFRAHNEDLTLSADMNLVVPANGDSPDLDLVVGYVNGDGRHTGRYLPAAIMPADVVTWVDRAVVNGRVTSGGAVVHGPVRDFPFDHGTGRFQVLFNVTHGILDYVSGWPRLEEMDAQVEFSGRSMQINAAGAKVVHSDIERTLAEIPDITTHTPVLHVRGSAHGSTADALRFLHESPLEADFGPYLAGAQVTGASRLDMDLKLPLDGGSATLSAGLLLNDSTLSLAQVGVDIAALQGVVEISDHGLAGHGIHARILGQPATIDIRTAVERGTPVTAFSAEGRFDVATLAGRYSSPWWARVAGGSTWRAALDVPRATRGNALAANLRVESPLRGVSFDLPEPLAKSTDEVLPFTLETRMPLDMGATTKARLGDRAEALIAWARTAGEGVTPVRGELRFGKGAAQLPAETGLRVAGTLPRISWSAWAPLLLPREGTAPASMDLHSIDVRVAELEAYGQRFRNVDLAAHRVIDGWQAQVSGPQFAGTVRIPREDTMPLVLDLERLNLVAPTNGIEPGAETEVDPRLFPPMEVRAQHLVYNAIDLGSLRLNTLRHGEGMHIDMLQLDAPLWRIRAEGDWERRDSDQISSFHSTVETENLGKSLAALGYADTVAGGNGRAELQAHWRGGLTDFSLARVDGNLQFRMEKGYLLDLEPGAGRIFGLLSLNALPRHLSFDFGDLFRKGLAYDRIKGTFRIENGNAYTDNLVMEGPAARIEVRGRVGLAARDYDQKVTVTPHATGGGLPLAGAVMGGLGIGATVYVFEQLFKEATRTHYSVKGPWDAPVVEQIESVNKSIPESIE